VTCSTTMASRPSTTPIVCIHIAPDVPASTVPIATFNVRFVECPLFSPLWGLLGYVVST
jgi:hypothetical protein